MDPTLIVTAAIFAMKEIQQMREAGKEVSEQEVKALASAWVTRIAGIRATIKEEMEGGK